MSKRKHITYGLHFYDWDSTTPLSELQALIERVATLSDFPIVVDMVNDEGKCGLQFYELIPETDEQMNVRLLSEKNELIRRIEWNRDALKKAEEQLLKFGAQKYLEGQA